MTSNAKAISAALALLLVFGTLGSGPAAQEPYWPYWRGPAADGMAVGDAPVRWSDTQNVKWRTEIPGLGHSSPVVWGDRIFLTTAIKTGSSATPATAPEPAERSNPHAAPGPQVEHTFDVICLDRRTGKIRWQRTAKTATPHEGTHNVYGSFASNSPVTDGTFVYAFFGSRGMYCYDMDGKLIWQKDLGVQLRMRMAFGEGMAPVLSGNRLILVFDHEGDSFISVLDKTTGTEIWRVTRDGRTNWAAPLVVPFKGRTQVVVAATAKVRSYDLENGNLIWECSGLGPNTIPQPVRQDDMVFVMSGYQNPRLMAIRLGREGDLTGTDAIVWTQTRGNSYTPSPVIFDNKLYVLTDTGMVSCYNARTGEPYYHQVRLPKTYSFKSSPVGVNGKLYLASENEDVIVLRMGETFEVLATNTMTDQVFIATPAITGGEIFLRSKTSVFCIRGT
jgi:outer membrane protein assembly factor BamB